VQLDSINILRNIDAYLEGKEPPNTTSCKFGKTFDISLFLSCYLENILSKTLLNTL
jgi:hypothetical protein